ncbi:hypothetical protein [Micromonospora sp. CPCC 205556]|uniref:hypothetical protein n=1 Tax=Micromonospora sp. CPCC 205556 TaxID=3122398 RepID=UPI002FF3DD4B
MSFTDPDRTLAAAPSPWAVWAAYAVPLCVLPSAVWRLSLVFTDDAVTTWYMIFLSALSMGWPCRHSGWCTAGDNRFRTGYRCSEAGRSRRGQS